MILTTCIAIGTLCDRVSVTVSLLGWANIMMSQKVRSNIGGISSFTNHQGLANITFGIIAMLCGIQPDF